MSKLRTVRLGDVIAVKHGFAFPGDGFTEEQSFPTLVTPGNFAIGGGFKPTKPKTFKGGFPEEYVLAAGDLIVSMTDLSKEGATLGLPALVPDDGAYLHNQRVGLVQVTDPCKVDRYFLHYFMRTAGYRAHILGTATGSTVRHTSPTKICSFEADLPDVAEQRAIAEALGALDDKIAANIAMTAAADELSRAVFTSMLNDSTSRPLSDLADFVNGKAFTKDASGTGRVVIRIAELNSGLGGSTVYNDIHVADQHLARPGDLLFAWSGSLTLHRWFRAEGIINQHIFKVIPKDGYPTWCVNGMLVRKLDEFKAIAADKATTMGHIQRRHLDEPVEVPVATQIERNDALMTALWQRALAAEEESLGLVEMRDALLPQLMSGKIRVKDAKQMVGDVV